MVAKTDNRADQLPFANGHVGIDHFSDSRQVDELLHIEQQHRTMARRTGLYDAIEKALDRGAFDNAEEAETFALEKAKALEAVRQKSIDPLQIELSTELDSPEVA